MLYLILSILTSTSLIIIFKFFEKWNVSISQAIVFNYITAASLGLLLDGISIPITTIPEKPWFLIIFILGIGYITFFNVLGICTQKVGVTIATVAFKMSMVIPIIAGFFLYSESVTFLKIAGIVLACASILLVSFKNESQKVDRKYLLLPLLLFIGSGFLDTLFKYTEKNYVHENEAGLFCALAFGVAAAGGILYLLFSIAVQKKKFEIKSIWAGILLGIPNYGSLYYLFKALRMQGMESSVMFPLNNMGIVAASTLVAFWFFREKLSTINWAGIALAIISIALIAWS